MQKVCGGDDYLGCLGMGLTDIQRMIPNDSLTACIQNGQSITDADWYADGKIGSIAEMLMLNLDNNLLQACEKLAMESFAQLCGGDGADPSSVSSCDKPFAAEGFGAKSLKLTSNASARTAEINGLIDFNKVSYTSSGEENLEGGKIVNSYPSVKSSIDATDTDMTQSFGALKADIDAAVLRMITINPRLAFCTEGRDLSQIKTREAPAAGGPDQPAGPNLPDRTKTEARFPRMLDPYITILVQAGISHARTNYDKKLKEMYDEAKASLQPKAGGIVDGNVCWMESAATAAGLAPVTQPAAPVPAAAAPASGS